MSFRQELQCLGSKACRICWLHGGDCNHSAVGKPKKNCGSAGCFHGKNGQRVMDPQYDWTICGPHVPFEIWDSQWSNSKLDSGQLHSNSSRFPDLGCSLNPLKTNRRSRRWTPTGRPAVLRLSLRLQAQGEGQEASEAARVEKSSPPAWLTRTTSTRKLNQHEKKVNKKNDNIW